MPKKQKSNYIRSVHIDKMDLVLHNLEWLISHKTKSDLPDDLYFT